MKIKGEDMGLFNSDVKFQGLEEVLIEVEKRMGIKSITSNSKLLHMSLGAMVACLYKDRNPATGIAVFDILVKLDILSVQSLEFRLVEMASHCWNELCDMVALQLSSVIEFPVKINSIDNCKDYSILWKIIEDTLSPYYSEIERLIEQ